MSIFKKKEKTTIDNSANMAITTGTIDLESVKAEPEEDNWIWVDAYKGMDKNMQGHSNFQYEIGKQYDIPKENVKVCESGFHCCLKLSHVFTHYQIGHNNRFFKVKALVRQKDYNGYLYKDLAFYSALYSLASTTPKLAAASIIIESELSIDEILESSFAKDFPEKYKKIAIEISPENAKAEYHKDALIEDGYCELISQIIVNKGKFDLAHALAQQKELSMDIRIATIFMYH